MYYRQERQKILQTKFRFKCECLACQSPENEKSDQKRLEAHKINDEIPAIAQRNWRSVVRMVERAAGLLQEEGIEYPHDQNYEILIIFYVVAQRKAQCAR